MKPKSNLRGDQLLIHLNSAGIGARLVNVLKQGGYKTLTITAEDADGKKTNIVFHHNTRSNK